MKPRRHRDLPAELAKLADHDQGRALLTAHLMDALANRHRGVLQIRPRILQRVRDAAREVANVVGHRYLHFARRSVALLRERRIRTEEGEGAKRKSRGVHIGFIVVLLMAIPLACAAQARPPPLPFAYVGKVVRDGQRYAVIVRDGTVDFVRAGDTIGGEYRVQSVADDRLVVMDLERGVVQTLALGASAAAQRAPDGAGAGLRLAGPSAAAIGEQFSLTLSLGSSAKAADGGSVELHFDPKVLQLRGAEAEGAVDGYAQIELLDAATAVQFRVVARQPTATEISVAADDQRAAHRLAITPSNASVPSPAVPRPRDPH